MSARRKKLERGRPTALTPALQRQFCKLRKLGCTIEDASASVGVDQATVQRWLSRGREEPSGIFHDFRKAVEAAKSEGAKVLLSYAHERVKPKSKGGEGADPLPLLAITNKQYSPQVNLHVTRELEAAVERIKQEFVNEPETLVRILSALAGEHRSEGTEDDS